MNHGRLPPLLVPRMLPCGLSGRLIEAWSESVGRMVTGLSLLHWLRRDRRRWRRRKECAIRFVRRCRTRRRLIKESLSTARTKVRGLWVVHALVWPDIARSRLSTMGRMVFDGQVPLR